MDRASIIVLAWPDTPVRTAGGAYESFFKLMGINHSEIHLAGHAALCLVNHENGEIEYFDFGRYITPLGTGRVRGKNTDPEVEIPLKATISQRRILNLKPILSFLSDFEPLHGEGDMWATLTKIVPYAKTKNIILEYQKRGNVKYGPFTFEGSNCSRFVADILQIVFKDSKSKRKFGFPLSLTPSPIGNVLNAKNKFVYLVKDKMPVAIATNIFTGIIHTLRNLLRPKQSFTLEEANNKRIGTLDEPVRSPLIPAHAVWLSGIGAGSWFALGMEQHKKKLTLKRYNPDGKLVYAAPLEANNTVDLGEDYQILYGTNAERLVLKQNEKILTLATTTHADEIILKIVHNRLVG